MTTKVKASRFRIRRPEPASATLQDDGQDFLAPPDDGFGPGSFETARAADPLRRVDQTTETTLDAIRREGLTGRQLRLARRVAMKNGLPATSDFDAVRLLRAAGIDPFQRNSVLELVATAGTGAARTPSEMQSIATSGNQLPQVAKPMNVATIGQKAEQSLAADVMKIQSEIARRRRRSLIVLAVRLFFFVFLPTLLGGYYYYFLATPMYSVRSEFVIQQAEAKGLGLGGLFSGTQFATSQDSIAVQGYLQSREALKRLDSDLGFRAHFSHASIDMLERLAPNATDEAAYKLYRRFVKIGYDPTEGIIRMDIVAADPELAAAFSRALIGYAEDQVDKLTRRLREDQMQGSRESYAEADRNMLAAQREVVTLQQKYKVLSSEVEANLITQQISSLDQELNKDKLSLTQMQANEQPNLARMDPLKLRIATTQNQIDDLRSRLTETTDGENSLAQVQSELLVAKANVETRQFLLSQSLQSLETSRVEANRQVRYLSLSVSPVVPDEAAFPRAFENTMVVMMIFIGIYLMISMTAAILREQVSA